MIFHLPLISKHDYNQESKDIYLSHFLTCEQDINLKH